MSYSILISKQLNIKPSQVEAVIELLEVDAGLQRLMLKNPTVDTLNAYCGEKGYHTLQDSGYRKVLEGLTTVEEVRRVSRLAV